MKAAGPYCGIRISLESGKENKTTGSHLCDALRVSSQVSDLPGLRNGNKGQASQGSPKGVMDVTVLRCQPRARHRAGSPDGVLLLGTISPRLDATPLGGCGNETSAVPRIQLSLLGTATLF